jgi:PAS domain S-box-containing protein
VKWHIFGYECECTLFYLPPPPTSPKGSPVRRTAGESPSGSSDRVAGGGDPRDTLIIRGHRVDEVVATRRLWRAPARLRATVNDVFAPLWLRGRLQRAEREAERIFEMSPALLAVAGFDGYLKRSNPAFEVFGYSRDELLSRPWIEFAHPADRERMLQAAASLERGADVMELKNRVVCRDGSLRWVEWSTRAGLEEGLFYAAGRDVTERRRTADEQAALRRVATLVARETAPEAVFAAVVREVGRVLGVDAAHIGRYDSDGTVVSVAQWGYATVPTGARFSLEGDSVSARVLRTGRPARMGYERASGAIADAIREIGIRSAIGAPIYVDGRPWGVMTVTSKGPKLFPAESESRLQNFTELVATAIANAATRAELRASRARIVAASDDARRRIERDLHDGTQQRLVSLRLAVGATQESISGDPHDLRAELDWIATGLDEALVEVRELSRGIHPAILSHGGIEVALKSLARRSTLPVEVVLRLECRLPQAAEVAAYYVVSEALANVAKHARASAVQLSAETEGDVVRIAVRDDGVGGAEIRSGSGLVGLRDRVEALGGMVDIHSPSGGGTALVVTLPLEVPEHGLGVGGLDRTQGT